LIVALRFTRVGSCLIYSRNISNVNLQDLITN